MGKPRKSFHERLWEKIDVRGPDECWPWLGGSAPGGYGLIGHAGKTVRATRVVYTEYFGDPGGLHVCHRCDNPPCCNPNHLFAGTPSDNVRDSINKGRNFGPNQVSEQTLEYIRFMYEERWHPAVIKELSGRLGLTKTTIRNCLVGCIPGRIDRKEEIMDGVDGVLPDIDYLPCMW